MTGSAARLAAIRTRRPLWHRRHLARLRRLIGRTSRQSGRGHRRNRSGLPLRFFTAPGAAGGIPPTARPGLRMRPAADHPRAGSDRRLPGDLAEAAAAGRLRAIPGVFHCYSGSLETAAILLKMGFYLGVDGPHDLQERPQDCRRSSGICPHDRLLLETDSPYLTPVPYAASAMSRPYLPLIGASVAEIWQMPWPRCARITTENACTVFGLAGRTD